jgi:hypoxanthine phosphoribosyltransferase
LRIQVIVTDTCILYFRVKVCVGINRVFVKRNVVVAVPVTHTNDDHIFHTHPVLIGIKISTHFQVATGRTVIVIEDIVDTGNTLVALKALFEKENVKEFKIATLFFKPEAYKKDLPIDYVGIRIPNKFIVGYGLDYDGLGRNLPEIYQLKD